MRGDARARHTAAAAKEAGERLLQEGIFMRETQVWSLGAAPAHRYYLLMLSTERQFGSISQSNSAACKHAAEVNVVSSQAVNLSTNNVSKHGHLAGACHRGARRRARYYLRGCSVGRPAEKHHISATGINPPTKSTRNDDQQVF